MSAFKVGEICIGVNLQHAKKYNGMECEIIGALDTYIITAQAGVSCESYYIIGYEVKWCDDSISYQQQSQLRRKQPPQTFTGEQRIAELFNVTITAGKVEA